MCLYYYMFGFAFVLAFVLFNLFDLFEKLCRLNEDRSFSFVF